ncbi:MAG: Pr6Pr family membrane protein, partial [Alphaproteobacteria bacterium]
MSGAGRGAARLYAAAGALFGLFALGLQLYLLFKIEMGKGGTALGAIVSFFSYFTILGNTLAVLAYAATLLGARRFFARPGVQTAIALYIVIVGIVYVLVLRPIWNPQGLAKLADVSLHYVTPALYFVYWLAFVDKSRLRYADIPVWLIFPALYAVYAVARGLLTGIYTYPFLEVPMLGAVRVALNIVVLVAAFGAIGAILVAAARALSRRAHGTA